VANVKKARVCEVFLMDRHPAEIARAFNVGAAL
jgi:hypothetical protein